MFPLRFVLAVLMLTAAQPALARTLRVLSYNIHHSEGRDGVYDLDRIASVILAAKPDLVALQELDQGNTRSGANVFQLQELAQRTDMQGYFGRTINYMGGEYGNGVLVAPWLTIVGTTNRALPSPGGGEARAVIQMGLSFDADPQTVEFNFFATHLDASNQSNRDAQAAYINGLVASSATPALLAGDMNSRPSTTSYAALAGVWNDATNIANPGLARTTQIDYIFYRSPAWRVQQLGRFEVNLTTYTASDHYPILAEFAIPEPATGSMIALAVAQPLLFRRRSCRRNLVGAPATLCGRRRNR
ncbi:endonuclease/exonuclease/phosphatase family protein [Lacipirellula sp.]|uniref:endonuclease/exonuclease/phosphatase family protein n=1 Tax=Lacipirellula sp. TaxID=2691419 RepID=UPI003D0D2F12